MDLREYINTGKAYEAAENEIRAWVEKNYPGLSIEFNWPAPEIVRTDETARYTKPRVRKITEAVNAKIGDVLEKRAEEIYIAERLERIYRRHPDFTLNVRSIEEVKTNRRFLAYLKELVV